MNEHGIFESHAMMSDDKSGTMEKITRQGIFLPIDCEHCGDEIVFELDWSEVAKMARHQPVDGLSRVTTGYLAKVVCPRCYQNYEANDWDKAAPDLSRKEAAVEVPIELGRVKNWAAFGRRKGWYSGQGPTAPGAGARPQGETKVYRNGIVITVPCPACGTVVPAKLGWKHAIALAQGHKAPGWDRMQGGHAMRLHCPACKGRNLAAQLPAQALNQYLQVAVKKGLVR